MESIVRSEDLNDSVQWQVLVPVELPDLTIELIPTLGIARLDPETMIYPGFLLGRCLFRMHESRQVSHFRCGTWILKKATVI